MVEALIKKLFLVGINNSLSTQHLEKESHHSNSGSPHSPSCPADSDIKYSSCNCKSLRFISRFPSPAAQNPYRSALSWIAPLSPSVDFDGWICLDRVHTPNVSHYHVAGKRAADWHFLERDIVAVDCEESACANGQPRVRQCGKCNAINREILLS